MKRREAMIEFEEVTKEYPGGTRAVESLDFTIKKGEFFVLIGPSGCGKTTTLKMINRLIDLTKGTIRIEGKRISEYDIHELRWSTGYVLQSIALFPHMTIEENIAIVPELKKWEREKIRKRAAELLTMVGLEPEVYLTRKPSELSGGQQQRIGVIRALAADPEIVLMDEPFSALDPLSREKLQDDLLDLQRNIKKTIVFVTHDMQEALKLGDRICVMKEGKIVQLASPEEIIANPADDFVREFVGAQAGAGREITAEKMMKAGYAESVSAEAVAASASLKEVLELLTDREEIPVEKDGTIVGSISRREAIRHMAGSLGERGALNE